MSQLLADLGHQLDSRAAIACAGPMNEPLSVCPCSAKWDAFLDAASEGGAVQNGTLAQDAGQAAGLWAIREGITESLAKNGVVYKYDLSLPVADLYRLVEDTQQRIGERACPHTKGAGDLTDYNDVSECFSVFGFSGRSDRCLSKIVERFDKGHCWYFRGPSSGLGGLLCC